MCLTPNGGFFPPQHLCELKSIKETRRDQTILQKLQGPLPHHSPDSLTSVSKSPGDMAGILDRKVVDLQNWLARAWTQEASDGFCGPKPSPLPALSPSRLPGGRGGPICIIHFSLPIPNPPPGVGLLGLASRQTRASY